MFKKIDVFFDGKYLFSTNMTKTCKEAKKNYLTYLAKRSLGIELSQTGKAILANPNKLKAFFDKTK